MKRHKEATARAKITSAAPDMARAGLDIVNGVLTGIVPVFGPMDIGDVIERGQPVTISAQQLAVLAESLRKAGAL